MKLYLSFVVRNTHPPGPKMKFATQDIWSNLWCDTPAVNLNHRLTGGSTVHTINIEIRATVPVSPEILTSVFVISLHWFPHREFVPKAVHKICAKSLSSKIVDQIYI